MSTASPTTKKTTLPPPRFRTADAQPISHVTWRHRDTLRANSFNPNHVAAPELKLLRVSLLENGWTQPVVITPTDDPETFEIVDGFHRWTLSGEKAIGAMTDFHVPTVLLSVDPAEHRLATIRHNRARGSHHVVKMADIVATLVSESGLADPELMVRLGMDREEVRRLRQRGDMLKHFEDAELSKGWVPDVPENRS